jgi:hypothetical protein
MRHSDRTSCAESEPLERINLSITIISPADRGPAFTTQLVHLPLVSSAAILRIGFYFATIKL